MRGEIAGFDRTFYFLINIYRCASYCDLLQDTNVYVKSMTNGMKLGGDVGEKRVCDSNFYDSCCNGIKMFLYDENCCTHAQDSVWMYRIFDDPLCVFFNLMWRIWRVTMCQSVSRIGSANRDGYSRIVRRWDLYHSATRTSECSQSFCALWHFPLPEYKADIINTYRYGCQYKSTERGFCAVCRAILSDLYCYLALQYPLHLTHNVMSIYLLSRTFFWLFVKWAF